MRKKRPKRPNYPHSHGTIKEIAFLEGLGTYSLTKTPRKELLRRYSRAAEDREYWGAIEKYRVFDYLRELQV